MRAQDAVRQWVDRWLAAASPGARLPVDRKLAELSGCSVMTVRRVLSEYARQGKVERVHGRGTAVPRIRPLAAPAPSSRPAAETLLDHLMEAISRGELKVGDPLPAQKSIRYAFSVSPSTVLAAYRRLCDRGLASRVGRSCRVGSFLANVRNPRHDKVWLFYHEQRSFEELFAAGEAAAAMRAMETELMAFGRTLCYAPMEEIERRAAHWRGDRDRPAGIVLSGWEDPRHTPEQLQATLARLAHVIGPLSAGGVPALVITANTLVERPGVRYLSLSHANTVTRRLLARCVCCGPYEGALFLIDESRVGLGRLLLDAFRMLPEVRNLKRQLQFRYVIVPRDHRRTVRSFFERVYTETSREHLEQRLGKYEPLTVEAIEQATTLARTMTQGLPQPSGRMLWVANDDRTGAEALGWCRERGIRVPGQVAIICLENSPHYRHVGLAACIHDWERAGYLMAHALIGDIPIARTTRGFISTSALVLPRLTMDRLTLGELP